MCGGEGGWRGGEVGWLVGVGWCGLVCERCEGAGDNKQRGSETNAAAGAETRQLGLVNAAPKLVTRYRTFDFPADFG